MSSAGPSVATLLVFTLGPEQERARRPLLPAGLAPAELALRRRCLEAALEAGRGAGCAVEVASPRPLPLPAGVGQRPQDGCGFGERLRAALAQALSPAEAPVLVVGTDVPGLTAVHLARALAAVAADPDRVAIGPSPDGGFYLLATRRPLDEVLARVPFCGRRTLAALLAALAAAGRPVTLLPALGDLDRRADLEGWLAAARRGARRLAGRWRHLAGELLAALADLARPPIPARVGRPLPVRVVCRPGRAPPRA